MHLYFVPFVFQGQTKDRVYVKIEPATLQDLAATSSENWQTDWESAYLARPDVDKFALKTASSELIALGAYQVAGNQTFAYIVYLESAPHSNPTQVPRKERKYDGIGAVMIAFEIKYSIDQGCRGVVVFEAKTDSLAQHYALDFHALELSRRSSESPRRFMLADEDAWKLFSKYLAEEEVL